MQCINCNTEMNKDTLDTSDNTGYIHWCPHCGTFNDLVGNWQTPRILTMFQQFIQLLNSIKPGG